MTQYLCTMTVHDPRKNMTRTHSATLEPGPRETRMSIYLNTLGWMKAKHQMSDSTVVLFFSLEPNKL